jgi:hypothetical protein
MAAAAAAFALSVLVRARRMFKECPHPDENQRMQLSRELGLEPRQIKFWFQNRRTQMKVCSLTAPCHSFTFSPLSRPLVVWCWSSVWFAPDPVRDDGH